MGKTFQKIHGCSVGNFEGNGDKIPQWIRANGGTYSKEMTNEVTHLITTKEAYKKNREAVREAKKLRTIKIVTYDWLEDSLLSKHRRPKREKPYLLETVLKEEREKAKNAKRSKRGRGQVQKSRTQRPSAQSLENFENGCLSTKTKLESYQITNVTYCATLVRPTVLGNQREKYLLKRLNPPIYKTKPRHSTNAPIVNPLAQQLQVYESNSQPHVYAAYVKYSRIGKSATHLLAPLGSSLDLALTAFKKFFKLRTGREWEKRFDQTLLLPMRDDEGNVLPPHESWYQYENQLGILASFMRHGPSDMPGGSGPDPGSVMEDAPGHREGTTGEHELDEDAKVFEGDDEDEQTDDEEKSRSPKRLLIDLDESEKEGDTTEYKGLGSGASTNVAAVIN